MQPDNLFEAKAESLYGTVGSHAGKAGFKIPDYQRTYDWKKENIKRLLEDCLNGYLNCWQSDSSFTFLGTIILVKEKVKESTFGGTSLIVVDGQQRLTTLSLLCCVLIESLISHQEKKLDDLNKTVRQWVSEEIQFHLDALFECVVGQLPERGNQYPFPRIIRNVDARASNARDAEYRSVFALFIKQFSEYYKKQEPTFSPTKNQKTAEEKRLFENYEYIKEQILLALDDADLDDGRLQLEYEREMSGSFDKRGVRNLFEKLDSMGDESVRNRALTSLGKASNAVKGLARLITFSSYLTKCVVLTRVETESDRYAFDIFDALNTTGEPLTAIETFRPRVIQFEDGLKQNKYDGSESQQQLENLKRFLDDVFINTDTRQRETKELLVTFALYLEGYKLGLKLNVQRTYLRNGFERIDNDDKGVGLKRRFVRSIADVAEFRYRYWNPDNIKSLKSDISKLCFDFIRSMKTSLAVPLMARFWVQLRDGNLEEQSFYEAIRAITSFIVLRRSVTGGTGGIDSEFRRLMSKAPIIGGDPLCAGKEKMNCLLSTDDLKTELLERYLKKPCDASNRAEWVEMASRIPLGRLSRPLCRFLLLAASHNARPDENDTGILSRNGVTPAEELEYLNYRTWDSGIYATVEHVAPDSESSGGWATGIYSDADTRHSIGNLVLLPQKENSAIGNVGWKKKKVFYSALVAKTDNEREITVQEAKRNGFSFSEKTEELINRGERLRMLDAVVAVENWDKEFIDRRTRSTLELAWDELFGWLAPNSNNG